MKLITEVSEQLEYISEEGKDGEKSYKIRGIFMQAEQQNRYKRTYLNWFYDVRFSYF